MQDNTLKQIREKLGHLTLDWQPALWLQTGIPELNEVAGHKDFGIPYGRIMELSGLESVGKTAITLSLAALAQQDNAMTIWGDFENSFDTDWAARRGLDANRNLHLVQPYVGTFHEKNSQGKIVAGKLPRLSTAQELCAEMEQLMAIESKKFDRMFVVVDSIPAMLSQGEAAAGMEGANLRTDQDLPKLLGRLLRRWVGLCQSYNALIIMINQLRQDPMTRFGGGWYTPGGNAPRFYSHIRLRAHRVKGSKLVDKKKNLIGIQGAIRALKNKSGGVEGSEVGYRLMMQGALEFLPVSKLTVGE